MKVTASTISLNVANVAASAAFVKKHYRHLQVATLAGRLPGGLKLPSTRTLADELRVSRNFEDFFLNMGDMLVKAGDWQTTQKIYANAKLAKKYPTWPYQAVLEERIAQAEANVAVFNAPRPEGARTSDARIRINSEFACMACHQE